MTSSRPGAIVLAAGASSRMGRPKAFLPLGTGETFVERIYGTLRGAGLDPIVVVTRREHEQRLRALLPEARVAVNHEPEKGQLSSLLTGLSALAWPPSAMVTLVDLPLVGPDTVRALAEAHRRSAAPLVRPVYQGRHGHPIVISGPVIAALAAADFAAGAKPVIRSFAAQSVDVPVADAATLADVDTPDDYARLVPRGN